MIKSVLISLFLVVAVFSSHGQQKLDLSHLPTSENLTYDIYYHWGVIWKKAGEGKFMMSNGNYNGQPAKKVTLYGRTLSFLEKFFPVRDTLLAYASVDGFIPYYYTKIINEGGYKSTDILHYSYKNGVTTTNIREIGNKGYTVDTVIQRTTLVYDMLTVFYYLRSIDLNKARPGEVFSVEVASGRSIYKLKFKFIGTMELQPRGSSKSYICHKVKMIFENTNGQVDDDTMIAYVKDDEARTPIQLEAKLRIGAMKALIAD